jgi:tetratricopeptide (TPR) repeat protein
MKMNFLKKLGARLWPDRDPMRGKVLPLVGKAGTYLQAKNYSEARACLLRSLEYKAAIKDPQILTRILGWLALTWRQTSQHREQIEFFSDYISKYPGEAIAHTFRAGAFWYAGELKKALDDYSRVLELDPDSRYALSGRGQVLVECGEYRRALEDLDRALKSYEELPIKTTGKTTGRAYTLNGRAAAYAGLGEFDRALEEFDQSIALCPENAWVYFNRAGAYESLGDTKKAIADYKQSLTMNKPGLSLLKRKYAETKLSLFHE